MTNPHNNKPNNGDALRETAELVPLVLEGLANKADFDRLNSLLKEDAGARRYYLQYIDLHAELSSLSEASVLPEAGQGSEPASPLLDRDSFAPAAHQWPERDDSITLKKAISVLGYAGLLAARRHAAALSGFAALLVITVVLGIVLITHHAGDTQPITAENRDGDAPPPITPPAVASLTAERGAVWDRRPGQDLYAGQRFTLARGFAEITTQRGAIAIVEAPATIELLDNDNAIRMHAGKLVGICQTDSSKGFIVHTPHIDVTDLGTRFGVNVKPESATHVHVFEGEIEVATAASSRARPERQRLTAGQALAAEAATGLKPVPYDPNAFALDRGVEHLRPGFAGTNAVWLGRVPGDLGQNKQQAEALQVFIEKQAHRLADPIGTDIGPGGTWDPEAQPGAIQVAADEVVDVYLLHFDLPAGHQRAEDFVIDFGRPILGVIVTQAGLDSTDATLGVDGVAYPVFSAEHIAQFGPPRGLNAAKNTPAHHDRASIDEGGHTLRLSLFGGSNGPTTMDQLRVIVRTAGGQP